MLKIHILSFSYKKGLPVYNCEHGGGFIFDCRGLPNPGRLEAFKMLTGKDKTVADFLDADVSVHNFLDAVIQVLSVNIDSYLERGFTDLFVAFGCTGGQHRSVYCAQTTAEKLRHKYPVSEVLLEHREIG